MSRNLQLALRVALATGAIVGTLGQPARAWADTVYSNLGAGQSYGNSAIRAASGISVLGWGELSAATPFQAPADYLLTELDVAVGGGPSPTLVQLRNDASGRPGDVIASWTMTFPALFANFSIAPSQAITGISGIVLRRGRIYWVAVLPADGGTDTWWYSNNTGTQNIKAESFDGGASWPGTTVNADVAFGVYGTATFSGLTSGGLHSCALRGNGVVECWGNNSFNQAPATRTATSGAFIAVTAGTAHTCALTDAGMVECWGWNGSGQAPAVRAASSGSFTQVSASGLHSCGLRSDGIVECWGSNNLGEAPTVRSPATGAFTSVAAGGSQTCALRNDGVVECWGNNAFGQAPSFRTAVGATGFALLAAGSLHTCAASSGTLSLPGSLECWGLNNAGQAPPAVSVTLAQISGGGLHSCGITDSSFILSHVVPSVLSCWGNNAYGQAGGVHQPLPGGGIAFVAVSAGLFHTCAIDQSRRVECWGNNTYGQAPAVRVPVY